MPGARLDFAELQGNETFDAEALACEAAHYRTVHHRAAQRLFVYAAVAGKRTHETSRETIARTCRIVDLFQRKRRHCEKKIAMDEKGAVFSALDHQDFRAHFEDVLGGAGEVVLAGQLARLV